MDLQTITSVLQDLHYPITKDELIQELEQRGLPEVKALAQEHLPPQTFSSAEEVMQKLPLGELEGIAGKLGL